MMPWFTGIQEGGRAMATPAGERGQIHRQRDMRGDAWKDAVEELLAESAERARAYVASAEGTSDLLVRIPVTFFMRVPREGDTLAGDPETDCACTKFQDEDGEVCICYGNCPDFPDICDKIPVFTEE